MKYYICEAKPRAGRSDYKVVHALGEVESIEDARSATAIWVELARQSNIVKLTTYEADRDYAIVSEDGEKYQLIPPFPEHNCLDDGWI